MLTVLAFYFGNRFGQVFDFNTMEITDGALVTVNSIVAAPAAISTASVPMLYAIGLAITVLIVALYIHVCRQLSLWRGSRFCEMGHP